MKTEVNNVWLPTLFNVANIIVQHYWTQPAISAVQCNQTLFNAVELQAQIFCCVGDGDIRKSTS